MPTLIARRHAAIASITLVMAACGLDVVGVDRVVVEDEAGAPDGSRDVSVDANRSDVVTRVDASGDVDVTDGGGTDADADDVDAADASDKADADAGNAGDANDAGDASREPPITSDDAGCPTGRGPAMAKSGKLCVDRTEVTRAQYAVFLAHDGPDGDAGVDGGPAPECKKLAHTPAIWPAPSGPDTAPVAYVDWCDADAFCRWSGKMLCGAPDGTPLLTDPGHLNKASKDAWYAACSNDGANTYPYGDTFSGGRCNLEAGAPEPVDSGIDAGSDAGCVGGYSGLFDMVGNVWEHVNGCVANACVARGGSFRTRNNATTTCANTINVSRTDRFDDMGFRCCATLP